MCGFGVTHVGFGTFWGSSLLCVALAVALLEAVTAELLCQLPVISAGSRNNFQQQPLHSATASGSGCHHLPHPVHGTELCPCP